MSANGPPSLPPSVSPSVITPGDIWPFKKQFGPTKSRQWHAAGRQHGSMAVKVDTLTKQIKES